MSVTLAFLFGLAIGSFLNVAIARLPKNQSVVHPRSRCPQCGREIRWYENIPVLSWLALRARCAGCGQRISAIYPLVELATAVIWALAYANYPGFAAARIAVFATVMLGIALTDLREYVIPDGFTVFGLGWCLGTAITGAMIGDTGPFAGPYDALIGACVGAGAVAIAGWLGEIAFRKEAMGFGDVTLMAVVGAAVGPARALLTIFIGALIGATAFLAIVYPIAWMRARGAGREFAPPLVPFGVFLTPAAVVTLLWGDDLVRWYNATMLGS